MATFYCLKNKIQSEYDNAEEKLNKRNCKYLSAICKSCGKKHNKFLKSDKPKVVLSEGIVKKK